MPTSTSMRSVVPIGDGTIPGRPESPTFKHSARPPPQLKSQSSLLASPVPANAAAPVTPAPRGRASTRLSLRENFRSRSSSIEHIMSEVRNAFDPNSPGIQVWHQLLLGCLIYEVMMLPFIATFEPHGSKEQWLVPELAGLYACELLFLADVYIELNTGYYEDGNVTLDVTKSRIKYLKSKRFVLDVLALPPLSLLLFVAPDIKISAVFLEFHTFIRVWRLPKYVAMLDDIYARYFVVLKMFKVLLFTCMLSHYVACFRFMFGYDIHHNNHWLPHAPDHLHGELSSHSQYLMSLFWAFGVLTGLFEGELPTTVLEFLFTIFVALCGFSMFTYVLATFFMISKCESGHAEAAQGRLNQLKHLLSFHRVPESLQLQATEYLTRYYTQSESNDRDAMRLLCPSIAKDIQVELLKEMVGSILFFRDCDHQFIIAITSLLELTSLPANVIVFNMGDEGDAMYVVNSGVLHVLVRGVKIREVRKGAFFGEMALFLKRPRYATVVTSTYCTLYKLVRFHVERLFEGYPEYAVAIPKRVEEMAHALFGRASGEALIIPDESLLRGNELKPPGGETKTRFANMIRKHMKKDKAKVSPASAPTADETTGAASALDASGDSVNSSPTMLLLAAEAIRRSKTITETTDPKKSKSDEVISPHDQDREVIKTDSLHLPRRASSKRFSSEHRLSASAIVSNALNDIYSQMGWSASGARKRYWWSSLLLPTAIDNESTRRMWWIAVLQAVLIYNWFLIPLQVSFQTLRGSTWYILALNVMTDLILWVDIYGNMNLAYVENSEKIWDSTRTAIRYARGWFLFDLVCVLPYWFFAMSVHHALPRMPRLLRILRFSGHFQEIDDFVKLNSKQRLLLFCMLLVVLYHVVACLHFSVTYLEGFSSAEEAWIPSNDIQLVLMNASHFVDKDGRVYHFNDPHVRQVGVIQYFRSFYYATNVLAALGLTMQPASNAQYGIALIFMLSGFFITATVVDNVQKRFTASAIEQKEFFATRSRIQIFLRRQKAPLAIHKRVNAFLDYWWSSHRGAVINELLEELPETIKREILQSICQPALQTLALLNGVRPVLKDLESVFLDNVNFILYGQGEIVYRQGDYASGLFFLLVGEVCIIANGGTPRSIHQGGFFGTAALQMDGNAVSYTERVTAASGCIVLFASREHIQAMKGTFEALEESFRALERRLLDPKLAKSSTMSASGGRGRGDGGRIQQFVQALCGDNVSVFDPDTVQMLGWETWLFFAMTVEWFLIVFYICFGVSGDRRIAADVILVVIELHFVVDMFVRSRLGFYEFGNKIMTPKLVRAKYFRSQDFVIDLLALLPLYMYNWGYNAANPVELLNANKLLRLIKVPTQFTALETKYLKHTLELRLFKLVYYTFLLTHICGCIWFDFASNASGLHSPPTSVDADGRTISAFGSNRWMPHAPLEDGSTSLQYFSSLFWSFGLQSASNTGNLPKTVPQCIFTVMTMISGFFLFAYVIGNFSDTIEMIDAENREFYAKLNSLRHLISHFQLPAPIADKFKNYFFFKHFHSITQEYLLESCLPPSLLTDIRMVHLQPMIVKVNFLAGMDASVTRMLVSQFSQSLLLKDEFVYKYGEEGSDMFFVFTGMLCTLLPQEDAARDASMIERKASFHRGPGIHDEEAHPTNPPQPLGTRAGKPSDLTKLNEITAGSYFGENALFFNRVRMSYVQATTSCILYRLSRDSLELVFDRYPAWKEKVLRIITIQQEQQRLSRLAYEEQKSAVISNMVAQVDQVNARAERTEEELLAFRRSQSKRKQSAMFFLSTRLDKVQDSTSRARVGGSQVPQWIIEFGVGTKAQSWYHLVWLKLMTATTIYVAVMVPYRISFDSLVRTQWLPVVCRELELLCEIVFLWDIWFNWRLSGSQDSMELYEQDHREAYKKERLVWDLLAAFPLDYVLSSLAPSPWYRINRCLKLRNLMHYLNEINRRSITNEMHRLRSTCLMYILAIYWCACMYFAIAVSDGYGEAWNAWRPTTVLKITLIDDPPSEQITLRVLRGLFFATTAFVKKGKTFFPDSTIHLAFTVIACFVGLLCMAFMLGEIASLFISYIGNEVEYRKNHITVELYLGRWKIQGDLKNRTQAFLSSLWSSHRGVDYQALLEEVPTSVRTESILCIARWPLRGFTDAVFRPICRSGDGESQQTNVDLLMSSLAQHLRFEGYPRNERVLVEGSLSKDMYFVVRGYLLSSSRSHPALYSNVSYVRGDFFGHRGLLGYSVSAFSVCTMRACDLLSLSAEDLLDVLHAHPIFSIALQVADTAALEMKQMPLAGNSRTMESRWGQTLMNVVNERRRMCDEACSDRMQRRAMKRTRAVLDRVFVTHSAEECYGSFRPLLELIVPNGFTQLHGAPRTKSSVDSAPDPIKPATPTDNTRSRKLSTSVVECTESYTGNGNGHVDSDRVGSYVASEHSVPPDVQAPSEKDLFPAGAGSGERRETIGPTQYAALSPRATPTNRMRPDSRDRQHRRSIV